MAGFNFTRFDPTTLVTHTTLNSNFAAVESQLGSIKNEHIAAHAGITSDKFADRYCVSYVSFLFCPDTWGDAGSTNGFLFQDVAPVSGATLARFFPGFNGRRCYFVGVNGYVSGYAASGGGNHGAILVRINELEMSTININAAGTFSAGGDFANPIMPVQWGDQFQIYFGKQTDTDATRPSAETITVTFAFKIELTE